MPCLIWQAPNDRRLREARRLTSSLEKIISLSKPNQYYETSQIHSSSLVSIVSCTFGYVLVDGCWMSHHIALLSSLLKDIKAERPKVTEKDNVRLLFVAKWFLEFFLCMRAKEGSASAYDFGYISEVVERSWIGWILKRMREAADDKVSSVYGACLSFLTNYCSQKHGQSCRPGLSASPSSFLSLTRCRLPPLILF